MVEGKFGQDRSVQFFAGTEGVQVSRVRARQAPRAFHVERIKTLHQAQGSPGMDRTMGYPQGGPGRVEEEAIGPGLYRLETAAEGTLIQFSTGRLHQDARDGIKIN